MNLPPNNKRFEIGDTVTDDDIRKQDAKWMITQGYLEPIGAQAPMTGVEDDEAEDDNA